MSRRLYHVDQTVKSVQHLGVSLKALLGRPHDPHDMRYEDTCSLHYPAVPPSTTPLKGCPCYNFMGLTRVNFDSPRALKKPGKKSKHLIQDLCAQPGVLTDLFAQPVNLNYFHFVKQTLAVIDTQAYLLEHTFFYNLTPQDILYNMDFVQWSTLTANLWYLRDLSSLQPIVYELLDQLMLRSGLAAHASDASVVGPTSAPQWGPLTPLFTVLPRLFDHLAFNLTPPAMTELKAGVMCQLQRLLTELNARTDLAVSPTLVAREGLVHLCTRALGLELEPQDETVDLLIWSIQHGQTLALRDFFCLLMIRVDSPTLLTTPPDQLKLFCNVLYHLLDRTTVCSLFFFTWLCLAFVYIWGHVDTWPVVYDRPTNALTGSLFYHHLNDEPDPHPCIHSAYPVDVGYFADFYQRPLCEPRPRTAQPYAPLEALDPIVCYLKRVDVLKELPKTLRWRGVLTRPVEGIYCRPALNTLSQAWQAALSEPAVDVSGWVQGWRGHQQSRYRRRPLPHPHSNDYRGAAPPKNPAESLAFVGPYSRQPLTRGQLVPLYLNSFKPNLIQRLGWQARHTPGYLLYKRHRFLAAAGFPHTPPLTEIYDLSVPTDVDVIVSLTPTEQMERFKDFVREGTTYEFIDAHQLPALQVLNATVIACDAVLCGSLQLLQNNRPSGRPSDDTIQFRLYAWFLFVTLPALFKKPHPFFQQQNSTEAYIELADRVTCVDKRFRPRQTHGPAKYYQGCVAHLPQPRVAASHVWNLMVCLFPNLKEQTYKSLFVLQFFIKQFLTQLPFILEWPDEATRDVPAVLFNAGVNRVRLWEAGYSKKPPVNFAAFEPVFAGPVTPDHARHLSSFFSALLSTAVGRQTAGVVTQSV
ncbi:protein ORF24 [Lake sturgeon herpesvirus]|nr:protein ORF24 [Lake sturgeon herpesvirus]